MKSKKPRRPLPPLCAVPGDDDGVAPETYFDPKRRKHDDRKVRQLCAQVARTLTVMANGELADPALAEVRVLSVEPAPDASILRVTVTGPEPARLLAHLRAATGAFRSAVAGEIHRKRAPDLRFEWAPDPDADAEADAEEEVEP